MIHASGMAIMNNRWARWAVFALTIILLLFTVINLGLILVRTLRGFTIEPAVIEPFKPVEAQALENISQWHLMGETPKAELDAAALPKSLINAELIGVFLAVPESDAMVAIRLPDGKEKIYLTGESLPGDVTIYKILKDSVILKRGDRYETLAFPEDKLEFEPMPKPMNFKLYED